MNPEHGTQSVLKRIERVIGPPMKKARENLKAEWRGETLVIQKATALQNRVDQFAENHPQAERDFTNAVGMLGVIQQVHNPRLLTDKQLYTWSKQIIDRSNSPTFDELDLETAYLHSFTADPDKPSQFREKVTDYLEGFCRETILGYFFHKAREGNFEFDKDKEFRQMRAVYHMEQGDHVAMNTGDGKTSVVIPAYSVYTALFEDRKDNYFPNVLVSSADSALTGDAKKKIKQFKDLIETHIDANIPPVIKAGIKLKVKMLEREAQQDVPKKDNDLEDLLSQQQNQLLWHRSNFTNIGTMRHDEVVFETEDLYVRGVEEGVWASAKGQDQVQIVDQAKRDMQRILPKIVFDEAHLLNITPYVRETRKDREGEKMVVDLDHIEDRIDLMDYMLIRMNQDAVFSDRDNNLMVSGQRMYLTSNGKKVVSGLRTEMIEGLKRHFGDKRSKRRVYKNLKKIINEELESVCDFKEGQTDETLIRHFLDYIDRRGLLNQSIKESAPLEFDRSMGVAANTPRISAVNEYIYSQFEDFVNTTFTVKKGVHYITPDVLRDNLRGTIMKRHRFSGMTPFYISLNERTPLIGNRPNIKSQILFPTWLKSVAQGNIVALSNDLYYTDPTTGERKLSPLGHILEAYTPGKVIDLAPKKEVAKVLPVPEPTFSIDEADLVGRLTADMVGRQSKGNTQQELVVCWDETMGFNLYESLKSSGFQVQLITAETSDEQADIYHEQLANGELKVLVTTGRKGFGADFKSRAGKFTDLRVNVVNPETVFQVAQAFGRRRAEKSETDFSIYFDQEFILPLASVLDQNKQAYFFSWLFKDKSGTYPEIEDLVLRSTGEKKPKLKPEDNARLKRLVIDTLEKNQNRQIDDWERTTEYESTFIETVAPRIKKMKREEMEKSWRKPSSPVSRIIESETEAALSRIGLEKLPFRLQHNLKLAVLRNLVDNVSTVEEEIYQGYQELIKTAQRDSAYAGNINAQKGVLIGEMEDYMRDGYIPQMADDLANRDSRLVQRELTPLIRQTVSLYGQIFSFMNEQLSKKGQSLEDVADFHLLNIPYYEINLRATPFLPNEEDVSAVGTGQRIVDKGNKKYVFDQKTSHYWPVVPVVAEEKLALLNGLPADFFNDKKYVDAYYPGNNITRFVRIVLKST